MTDLFSNREIASGIWIALFAVWATTKTDIRKSFGQLVRALLNKHVIRILTWATCYVAILVAVLQWTGLWGSSNLKITIYWFLSAAIVTVFRSNQRTSDPKYFKQAVRDNIAIVVVLEYVVNLYSFNIVAELVILPLITIVLLVQAFSEGKEKYASIQTPLNVVLIVYFLALLVHAANRAHFDFSEYATFGALGDLLLPPMLSIAFLPFMFFLLIYFSYGQAFSQIRFSIPKELMADAMRLSFRKFQGDRFLLLRWARIISYTDIKNKGELIKSIERAEYMKWREEHPSIVIFERGWSPRNAIAYLSSLGIVAGDYNPSFDRIWAASAEKFSLKDESPVLCNNIAYYIYGEQSNVRQLKLMLNVNEPDEAIEAHERFLEFCDELAGKALNCPVSPETRKALLVGDNKREVIRNRIVTAERHDWAGSTDGAYEVKFEILHPDFEPR